MNHSRRGTALVMAGVLTAILIGLPAAAEGVLVVGVPSDGLRQGFAYGYAHSKATTAEATEEATRICREQVQKNDLDPGICTIVQSFSKSCVAVAMDTVNRWAGWSIAPNQRTAERDAIAACRKGGKACKLADAGCDK